VNKKKKQQEEYLLDSLAPADHGRTPAGKMEEGNLPHVWYLAECACQELVIAQERTLHRHPPIH
jgi:hypothetical protein